MTAPTITVNGTFRDAAGDPMSGTLKFRLNAPLVDSVGNIVSERVEITSTLDSQGRITDTNGTTVGLVLYCTSGGDIAPSGLLYDVSVEVGSRPHKVHVALPDSLGSSVDWADLVPVPASTGVVWTVPDLTPEQGRDLIGSTLVAGSGISVTVDDPGDTVTLAADGTIARLASPAFTGNPTAPTPTVGDNDTSVATTAFVHGAVADQHTTDLGTYQPLAARLTTLAGRTDATEAAALRTAALDAVYVPSDNLSANMQRLLALLKRGLSDAAWLVIGDSTGNETTEWVYLTAAAVAPLFPAYTVIYHLWDDTTSAYDATPAVTLQTGTGTANSGGPFTLHVWNASVAGKGTFYPLAPNFEAMVGSKQPDLVMISMGHNEGASSASQGAAQWRGQMLALTETVTTVCPLAGVVLIGQNPETANNDQAARIAQYQIICAQRGYGFVDVHQAFTDTGNVASYTNVDGIHPNSSGSALWASVVTPAFTYQRNAPQRTQPQSPLHMAAPTIATNADFSDFSSSVPTGWTLTGATTAKDLTHFDSSKGYSVRIQATGAAASFMQQSLPQPTSLRSKWVTVAARVRIPTGQATTAGRIAIIDSDGSTSETVTSRGGVDARDDFCWVILSKRIRAAATSVKVNIYGDTAANSGADVSVDRVLISRGVLPYEAGPSGSTGPTGATGAAGAPTYTYVRYTASDTFVVPAGITTLQRVRLLGGGGGGGGGGSAASTVNQAGGAGGGAGGVTDIGGLAVTGGESLTITIPAASGGGAGGAAGGNAGTAGTAGSTVTLKRSSTVLAAAQGGAGGAASAATSTTAANGGLPGPSTSTSASSGIIGGGGGVSAATVVLPTTGGQACGGGGGGATTSTNGGGGGGSPTDMTQPGNTAGRGTAGASGASGTTAGVNGTAATLPGCGGGGGGGGATGGGKGGDGGAGSTGLIEIWY